MKSIILSLLFICSTSFAEHDHPTKEMPKEFEKLKALVGKWEATTKSSEGKEEKSDVTYELTSGDTVVMERLFNKSKHEMVTMYGSVGSKMAATHFCALGNQPKMTLKNADDKKLVFEMKGTDGIKSAKEMHMHGLTLTFNDATHVTQEWTLFDNGKKKDVTVINLTKK